MKKLIINLILILLIILCFFIGDIMQGKLAIFNVMPNVFVILTVLISMFSNKKYGLIYGMTIGILLDFMYSKNFGVSSIILMILGFSTNFLDKNFSKDNRITILIFTICGTLFYELMYIVINYIIERGNVEILTIAKTLTLEIIYNCLIVLIIYPLIQKFGFYMENEFKSNKILTKYY